MNRPNILFLFAALALGACETAHDAAVSTFRVIDAPHQYVRRQLGIDQEPQTTTTTTATETTYTGTAPYPPQQPYAAPQPAGAPPPPPPSSPVQAQRQVTTNEPEPAAASTTSTRLTRSQEEPTAPSEARPSATPRTVSSQSETLPYAKPVPGKPGYVFSPYDPNGGYVDVKGYSPGQKVKDPYSGKIFLVP